MGKGKGYTRYCTGIRNIMQMNRFSDLLHTAVACTLGVQ